MNDDAKLIIIPPENEFVCYEWSFLITKCEVVFITLEKSLVNREDPWFITYEFAMVSIAVWLGEIMPSP